MCFLFLDPKDEVGPSISSSVVLCSFVLLVYIVVLVLVVCLCTSSVRVVATFSVLLRIFRVSWCPLDRLPARRKVSLVVGLPP